VGEDGLRTFPAFTAAITTELALSGPVRHLAVWRLLPASMGDGDPVWEHIVRVAAPASAYLYVPAFSLVRPVVQRIGVRLTEVQPILELTPGAPVGPGPRPTLVEAAPGASLAFGGAAARTEGDYRDVTSDEAPGTDTLGAPDFDAVSPVLIGRREAWGLAHFVYMAVEAREIRELRPVDYRLEQGGEELLFIPAAWDPRYIHESNWRLLLREFDGLVA
jgi:hypothetical protein